ncbi:integrin alpha-8-like [Trichoplusia ni]|uniref:Integrin alpha-8-like n=1 Tax=Trichoplusia ni TaxID=7111 RepID=A0A7E5X574_TRINI|nr:integrin alpha-8-like [Trichoplusia ni]
MNWYIWACLLTALPAGLAIYHEYSAVSFTAPDLKTRPNDTFFGYSITYDSEHKNLIISSPAENDIGEVYKCTLNDDRNCTKIPRTVDRYSTDYKHKYLFGATVKAGPKFVVMCAPRFVELNRIIISLAVYRIYGSGGRCYSYKNGVTTLMKTVDAYEKNQVRHNSSEQTFDTFGWSIDVGSNDAVIVGGPGMHNGEAMLYNVNTALPRLLQRIDHKTAKFNFGYSVAAGTFINNDLFYAVGSTYGDMGNGKIYFYNGLQWSHTLKKEVDPNVVGSMFGAVLCAAVLNGNRTLNGTRTDLLVGAPTYATESDYDVGAVYVYLALNTGNPPVFKRKIVGQSEGAMFGSAICNMRDLNGDNKDEIAIGAPFENGRGAVYIYSGMDLVSQKTEQTLTWLQRIEPQPDKRYTSFGFSLTRLYDYDDNGCDELAIGAPHSDAVVLLRCIATVTVKLITKFPNLQNRLSKTDFTFDVCLLVDYPTKPDKIIANLSTTVEMIHPFAKLTTSSGTYTFGTSLEDKKTEYCNRIPFTLPRTGKYDSEIDIVAASTLLDSPVERKDFDSSRVMLSDRSELTLQYSVWAAECAGNKECVPNLHLTNSSSIIIPLSFHREDYKIGSSKRETFSVNVTNTGEVAYDACLRLRITGTVVFQHSPACVTETNGTLLCTPAKPIANNAEWSTGDIVLDMEGRTNQDRDIQIDSYLYTRCRDFNYKTFTSSFKLQADYSGFSIAGLTNIGNIVNITKEEVLSHGKQMEHIYTITNNGMTNWKDLTTLVALPKEPFIKYNDIPVTLYINDILTQSNCTSQSTTEKFYNIKCKIGSLRAKDQVIKIIAPMNIVRGTLDGIIDDKNITINSSLSILLPYDGIIEVKGSIMTTIQLKLGEVPLWVIILASIVGLCILFIIAFILYEVGFLRRKNKEKLLNLKKSVYRQSMRRSTMMERRPRHDDRTQMIVEELQEDVH